MPETTPISATDMPDGEYAIVEVQGHRTLIGRVTEIERFGTKLMQVEPLFNDVMLGPVLVHGSMLYQFTPCSAAVAFQRRPKENYQLPATVFATVPALALPSEPLLGRVILDKNAPDWIIVGGESGPNARPMNMDWARSLCAQSADLGRVFNFKQVGGRGADKGGHTLDGVTYFGRPEVRHAV